MLRCRKFAAIRPRKFSASGLATGNFSPWNTTRYAVAVLASRMAFVVAFIFAAFAAVLYVNGPGWPLGTICSNTFELCRHPTWPLYAAIAFGLGGLVFRANQM
jgi:hypothetical protein